MGGCPVEMQTGGRDAGALVRALEQAEQDGFRSLHGEAEALLAEGEACGDPGLVGTARFYLAERCYTAGEFSASAEHLTAALDVLRAAGKWELLGRSYNMLGLLLDYQGDYVGAIDCFYTGIEVCRTHGAAFSEAMLCQNLSLLFEENGDHESALEYRISARTAVEGARADRRYGMLKMLIDAMLLRLYLHMGRTKEARRQKKVLDALLEQYPEEKSGLNVLICQTEYENYCGDPEKAAALLARAQEAFRVCGDLLEYFDDCLSLARCLADMGQHEQAAWVLERTEQGLLGRTDLNVHLRMQLQACRIECCRIWGEAGRALREAALENYYDLSCQSIRSQDQSRRRLLQLRHVLAAARSENERLARSAGTDALTGLPNRRRLGEVQEEWFDAAQSGQRPLAVGMLDIDNFKGLNDKNGHAGGDRCLQYVARLLAAQADGQEFAARYGGDEFMVLFLGLDDAEILARLETLRRTVEENSASLGCGPFTISVGARSSVPIKSNRVWDFTSTADEALYCVKRSGRNRLLLVHSRRDLPLPDRRAAARSGKEQAVQAAAAKKDE
jgi:diguanylate cyclase (GGDEF)-like protein